MILATHLISDGSAGVATGVPASLRLLRARGWEWQAFLRLTAAAPARGVGGVRHGSASTGVLFTVVGVGVGIRGSRRLLLGRHPHAFRPAKDDLGGR